MTDTSDIEHREKMASLCEEGIQATCDRNGTDPRRRGLLLDINRAVWRRLIAPDLFQINPMRTPTGVVLLPIPPRPLHPTEYYGEAMREETMRPPSRTVTAITHNVGDDPELVAARIDRVLLDGFEREAATVSPSQSRPRFRDYVFAPFLPLFLDAAPAAIGRDRFIFLARFGSYLHV